MTGRAEPQLELVLRDLAAQARPDDEIDLIVIDALGRSAEDFGLAWHDELPRLREVIVSRPKPNPWQGEHRQTDRDWWATANARNTALVLCPSDYIAFLDDRCRLGPSWLETVRRGRRECASVLCGSYDKLEGDPAAPKRSEDHRRGVKPARRANCGGGWLYGCTFALPLEWAYAINGFEEGCDGLTGEDYIFGLMLEKSGRRIDFAPELYVLQDRTAQNVTCKGTYACRDKGTSPNDKSHAALSRFGQRTRTMFTPDLYELRARIARGEPWPLPEPGARDWYDNELLSEMKQG